MGGKERSGTVEHSDSRPFEPAQGIQTGLDTVERRQDVESPERNVARP